MNSLVCTQTDLESLKPGDRLLQSPVWARQKEGFGWTPRVFAIHREGSTESFSMLVLSRSLAAGLELAYVPHGPGLEHLHVLGFNGHEEDSDEPGSPAAAFLEELAAVLKRALPQALCIRFDLDWELSSPFKGLRAGRSLEESQVFGRHLDPEEPVRTRKGSETGRDITWELTGLDSGRLRKASADIQPPDTVILPLPPLQDAGQEDESPLLSAMKSKTRYNVRLALRKGVRVESVARRDGEVPAQLDEWYELYRITEARNAITVHEKAYYERLFSLSRADQLFLYLARHESDLLAGIIVALQGERATYLYGASSNQKRNLMPSYALQFQAMEDMRRLGARDYDLFGIPPWAGQNHPMYGLYQFKTGFGGRIVHTPGAWDYPLKPLLYRLYRLAETLRMYYYRVLRKRVR